MSAKVLAKNVFEFMTQDGACKTVTLMNGRNKMPHVHANIRRSGIWIENIRNTNSVLTV
jgi:translation initiation factor IF-1